MRTFHFFRRMAFAGKGRFSFVWSFCMSKKRYPIISILVAIVWAVFFYPKDRPAPATAHAAPSAPAAAAVTAPPAPIQVAEGKAR
jgi:hypothetical protein